MWARIVRGVHSGGTVGILFGLQCDIDLLFEHLFKDWSFPAQVWVITRLREDDLVVQINQEHYVLRPRHQQLIVARTETRVKPYKKRLILR